MELLGAVATVLGVITGLWFLWDKGSAVNWTRFSPKKLGDASAAVVQPTGEWPLGIGPDFPVVVQQTVAAQLKGFRLPSANDITGEWAEYGDAVTLSPFFAEGSFTGKGKHEFAFFVLNNVGKGFRIVALADDGSGELVTRALMSGEEAPQSMFLRRVKRGRYRPGQSAIKLGSPKTVRLKCDGINVGSFGSADSIFIWNPKAEMFDQVWMSD